MSKPENVKTEKQAIDLRAIAREQAAAHSKVALVLAETLFDIKYSVVRIAGKEMPLVEFWKYRDDGHHTAFEEYAEHELGMHGRTAENYVHVHDVLILGEGIKVESLPPSITKLIQLARIAGKPDQDTKAWVKRAHEMTCCEFQSAVEEVLTGKPSHAQWSFWMSNRDIKAVERGLKRAKEILETRHNGETLAQIVDEWCTIAESNATRLRLVRKVS